MLLLYLWFCSLLVLEVFCFGTNRSRMAVRQPTPTRTPQRKLRLYPKKLGATGSSSVRQKAAGPKTQVAGLVPIASGQPFSFHFTFDEDGYLYIFGPGDNNQLTAFLTTKPQPDTGLTTNKVSKGKEFSFPKGNTLTLDKNPGTDNFTIIFSKSPLSSPSFLDMQVTFEPLTASQQADFKAFVSKYQGKPPVIELDDSNPKAQFVKVKTTSDRSNNPIVFDIRIQHN